MKETAFEHFQKTYVKEVSRAKRLALEEFYQQYRDELVPDFLESLRRIAIEIGSRQQSKEKMPVAYINYAMLRTAIQEKSHLWRIDAYDNFWYRDRQECIAQYDAKWAFRFLDEFEAELEPYRKMYLNQIEMTELELLKLREASKYQYYVIDLARYALKQADVVKEFREIATENVFQIRVGEYFDFSEVVYKEDCREKEAGEIKAWLEEKEPLKYAYEVFRRLDLAEGDYQGIDLRYSDLRESNLSGSNLQKAVLTGAQLSGACLEGTDFSGAQLFAADFHQAKLGKAVFSEAEGRSGLVDPEKWLYPGFQGVDFRGADLEEAVFENADFRGADFCDARLVVANFEGAELQGAIFPKNNLHTIVLDEEQRQAVIWR